MVESLVSKNLIARGSVVISPHHHSDPSGVLKDLCAYPGWRGFDERWLVIDRDEIMQQKKGAGGHSAENFCGVFTAIADMEKEAYGTAYTTQFVSVARNKAAEGRKPLISVAWSNPCFEFWLLLHFLYRDTGENRDKIQASLLTQLRKHGMMGADDSIETLKNNAALYALLEPLQEKAVAHAEKLLERQAGAKIADCNPATTVHLLVSALKQAAAEQAQADDCKSNSGQ